MPAGQGGSDTTRFKCPTRIVVFERKWWLVNAQIRCIVVVTDAVRLVRDARVAIDGVRRASLNRRYSSAVGRPVILHGSREGVEAWGQRCFRLGRASGAQRDLKGASADSKCR